MSVNQKVASRGMFNFLFYSILGVLIFFIPVTHSKTPLVFLIDTISELLGSSLQLVVVVVSVLLVITCVVSKFKNAPDFVKRHHQNDSILSQILYVLAAIFGIIIYFNIAPEQFMNPEVGPQALDIASSVFITIIFAGGFVSLISEFGLLEFIGTLIEPIMRPVYKLPGHAAVDGVASFVCAPSVGVFLTNKIYKDKLYTKREAASIATNFSVCSLGFFLVLTTWADILHLYPHVILTSFVVTFIIATITIRVPPLSLKPDEFIDGTPQNQEDLVYKSDGENVFKKAFKKAFEKGEHADIQSLVKGFYESIAFSQKVVSYILSVATIALLVVTYTPVFQWLGAPVIPFLKLLGIPNAKEIAPSVIVGITELALPTLLITGKGVAVSAAFFIVVLSSVQIIFFAESANAILESDIPLNILDLVIIFLIRTVIAMPLVAIAAHLLF